MIHIKKILIGGFPCTEFSIAQKVKRINKIDFTADEFIEFHNNTEQWWLHISKFEKYIGEKLGIPDYKFALGLQLFFNCIAALDRLILESNGEKVYYLFENVSSMKKEIKVVMEEILSKLYGGIMVEINSSLVSAQNRKRIYFTNAGNIEQPEDRGILLRDVLESGISCRNEKAYCLDANYYKGGNLTSFNKQSDQRMMVAEPVGDSNGKSYCLTANYANGPYPEHTLSKGVRSMVAEPVRIGTIENELQNKSHDSKQYRVYSPDGKATTLCGQGGGVGAKTGLYAVGVGYRNRREEDGNLYRRFETHGKEKANALTTVQSDSMIATPACLRYERTDEAKAIRKEYEGGNINIGMSKLRNPQPRPDGKSNTLTTVLKDNMIIEQLTAQHKQTIYEVCNGLITIKDKQYPIKLPDGYYIIRKLTITECCRLQTLPDTYCKAVSNSQAYKGLGNGWTAEVIIHILKHMNIPLDEEIEVLSMYDGIGTGRYCFDKMGYKNIKYFAYEIDKYAMQVSNDNYPDIVQCGDAFQIRDEKWSFTELSEVQKTA